MDGVAQWGSDTPLVGREAELGRLTSALRAARSGRAGGVLVAGEAGVGKTRLLDEVVRAAAAAGDTVLVGHCVDIGEGGLPYLPFGEMLSAIARNEDLAGALDEQPALLAHPAVAAIRRSAHPAVDGTDPLQLFDAVAALITRLSADRPVVLLVEDLHWADQSTRDLLRYLLSRLRAERVCILASYRADDLYRRHPLRPWLAELVRLPIVERLDLQPLAAAEVAGLVRALHPGPLAESELRRIIDAAEGNAFYAQELLAARVNAADPSAGGPTGGSRDLPASLTEVLLARVEQLSAAAQLVVRCASVAGRRVEHEALRTVASLPDGDLDEALREATGRHLLVAEDDRRYAFRHALLREATYSDLLPGERVRIHAAFAAYFERPGFGAEYAAARAHHYWQSHDFPWALSSLVAAADQAAAVGAPAEELRHLESVLELWSAVPDAEARAASSQVAVTIRASVAALRSGQGQRSLTLGRAALDLARPGTDLELTARARYTLAQNLIAVDEDRPAYKQTKAALELIPADPPSETRLWALATHVLAALYVRDIDGAKASAVEALAAAEVLGADDARADVMMSLMPLQDQGRDTDAGLATLEEALALARKAGNPNVELRALFTLGIGRYEAGDIDAALQWATEGLARAETSGLSASPKALDMRMIVSLARFARGELDESLIAATIAKGADPQMDEFVRTLNLWPRVARGEAVADRVDGLLASGDQSFLVVNAAAAAGIDDAGWSGDADRAVRVFDRACELLIGSPLSDPAALETAELDVVGLRLCALVLSAIADRVLGLRAAGGAEAAEWSSKADTIATAVTMIAASPAAQCVGPEARGWLARAEAEYARVTGREPVVAWRRAIAAFEYGEVYEQARGNWRLAEALLADGDHRGAAECAAAALESAERMGAVPLRDAVTGLIRRGRLGVGERRWDGDSPLTPREADVLALLAQGRTNRQIGSELFISDKTASVHVSNIFVKLGVSNRTEAVAAAHRRGLV